MNTDFDYFYKLEPELAYKFVNFNEENERKASENDDEEVDSNVDTLNNSNETLVNVNELGDETMIESITPINFTVKSNNAKLLNETGNASSNNLTIKNEITQSSKITNSTTILSGGNLLNLSMFNTSFKANSSIGTNKFSEQVIPVRGYYKLQVFPSLYIEMTDNAETYEGLLENLEKIADENEFLKPLNLIYLANLNDFDSYFGLNKTFNTSTTSLTKNIQSITTSVLQSNNKTTLPNYVPLLNLLNNTISKINLTSSLNSSEKNSLEDDLKNSLKISIESNSTQIDLNKNNLTVNAAKMNSTQVNKIANKMAKPLLSNQLKPIKTINQNNSSNQLNQTTASAVKSNEDEKIMNLTSSFANKNYTQIYIGNVDGNNTLSSLKPFVGCISGVVFNNQLINLTKITEKRYGDELRTGKILNGCNMLCSIKNCQNSGKCLDNWTTNRTTCNCTNTSYTGDRCDDDLGSLFNSFNHLFYRLDARKPRNLLEDQVRFELAFNFDYNEYFIEKNRYYHQENEESNLHKHNRLFSNDEILKEKWNFDNRIILLIIYEIRYVLLYVNKDNSLILSDVDNKGNGLFTCNLISSSF